MDSGVKHLVEDPPARKRPAALPMTGVAEPPADPLSAALLDTMMLANRVVTTEAMRAVPDGRLTPPQFRILNYLHGAPGVSLSEVASHLGVRLPTASVMLVKLASEGHVVRTRHPDSRRRMQLVLTRQGEAVVVAVRSALLARLNAGMGTLEPADRAALDAAVPALQRLLGAV